ncbi:hypothetical protein CLAIMM_09448 [Cladophialophora immunda]|nr:hypothetical protein CLAIMM_09448 [Cladophialophora immunda]
MWPPPSGLLKVVIVYQPPRPRLLSSADRMPDADNSDISPPENAKVRALPFKTPSSCMRLSGVRLRKPPKKRSAPGFVPAQCKRETHEFIVGTFLFGCQQGARGGV